MGCSRCTQPSCTGSAGSSWRAGCCRKILCLACCGTQASCCSLSGCSSSAVPVCVPLLAFLPLQLLRCRDEQPLQLLNDTLLLLLQWFQLLHAAQKGLADVLPLVWLQLCLADCTLPHALGWGLLLHGLQVQSGMPGGGRTHTQDIGTGHCSLLLWQYWQVLLLAKPDIYLHLRDRSNNVAGCLRDGYRAAAQPARSRHSVQQKASKANPSLYPAMEAAAWHVGTPW